MTDDIREALMGKRRKEESPLFLSTGCSLLNLACSGRVDGGFQAGRYYFFVGDSNSGKTWLGLSCLAEAANDSRFDGYRLIYDDVEGGALMNVRRFFGGKLADRLEPPRLDLGGEPAHSDTVEDFYYNADDALNAVCPCVYVLDSQDGLSSMAEREKFDKTKKAHRAGKDALGSWGDAKAKVHSANIRKLLTPLRDTGSILVVLNQTRDSFDVFERSTYSGGRALKFYATLQLWSSVKGQIVQQVKGKKRQLGVHCKVRVKKNRITGWDRTVVLPIYHSHGLDPVGANIDYLIDEGVWSKDRAGMIEVKGIGPKFKARRDGVVEYVEARGLEGDLDLLVEDAWDSVERACAVKRKRRYQ